jgi:hypothetical protein
MIPITMKPEDWQQVLNLLATHPFSTVAPLINQIQQQASAHLQRQEAQQRMAGHSLGSGNGVDLASGEDPDRLGVVGGPPTNGTH